MSKKQSLVNAQLEINRAVFAMNQELNLKHIEPEYIRHCIDEAINDLKEARKGYPLINKIRENQRNIKEKVKQ